MDSNQRKSLALACYEQRKNAQKDIPFVIKTAKQVATLSGFKNRGNGNVVRRQVLNWKIRKMKRRRPKAIDYSISGESLAEWKEHKLG